MATVSIVLPDPVMGFVEERARRYGDAGTYVRELIERDRERIEKIARMQELVDEARAAGPGERSMDDIRNEAREAVAQGGASHGLDA